MVYYMTMKMIDIGDKSVVERTAVARGELNLKLETLATIKSGKLKKGDVLTAAKLAGIQASGCSPVTKAFKHKRAIKPVCGQTLAVAIECGSPLDGQRALDSVKESGGFMEAVPDREIMKARGLLDGHEGIFAEPAGAASLAGLIKANERGQIPRNSKVVCLVTGHGLKVPYKGVKGKPVELKTDSRVLDRL